MQLSKIILYNSVMSPPRLDDLSLWLEFKENVNDCLHLDSLVEHWLFDVVVSIYVLLCYLNGLLLLFRGDGLT